MLILSAEDLMGWAIAHFQFCVSTLQWCRDRRGAVCTTGSPACTAEDLPARAGGGGRSRGGLSQQTSLGSLSR